MPALRSKAMTGSPRMIAAAVSGLVLLLVRVPVAQAQSGSQSVTRITSLSSGSISGTVKDERGEPISGALVSALGPRTATTVTDGEGRFEIRRLSPGPYVVRAHVSGFVAPRGQVVEVRTSARSASAITLRRSSAAAVPADDANAPAGAASVETSPPIVQAGLGLQALQPQVPEQPDATGTDARDPSSQDTTADDHGEIAWRLKHLRRGILKDVTVPDELLDGPDRPESAGAFGHLALRSDGLSAASLFSSVPLTGQFNLLTTGSFDTPRQLFTSDFSRSIASVSVASPVGDHADLSMRGALTQGDISSWFVAGAYATRVPARHRYVLGWSYTTQRYDGGNPAALRDVSDGNRNVGAVYGFDTITLAPTVALTVGARFSRYDYLADEGLLSPRVEVALSPMDHFRVNAVASSRAVAPGATEFLPPIEVGLWLPPQRTFSSLAKGAPMDAQRIGHLEVEAERDFGASTVSVRAYRQHVDDQLVTVFGDDDLSRRAGIGHYFVGNAGDVDAIGWTVAYRTTMASRVTGSVEYSTTRAQWGPTDDALLLLVMPVGRPADRVHDFATTVEANVPETSTRILVVARMINASATGTDRQTYDPRFDFQLHQSLPFMDFSAAKWEALVALRNTFHEAALDASVFDELMVVRPPKRIVGGLTLRF
jgi:carboxypeptidase family protein/TonB-dependent receptor-like protein